jgi:DNA-binding NarL/FixJ family response regulator
MNSKSKVLIIEDETILRENLAELLTLHGYEVGMANDGLEGLEIIQKETPDLIICDIKMPKMDGYELFGKVKELNENFTFFIFLSAKVEKDDIRIGMNLGADDYLTKPISSRDLIRAVEARLSLRENLLKEVSKRVENSIQEDRIISKEDAESILGNLSKSELRVLYHVAQEKSTQEIADKTFLSPKTIENHRHNISKKLNLRGGHSVMALALKIKPYLKAPTF